MKFEDLIDNTDSIIRDIWSFMGLDINHDIKKNNFIDSYGDPWFSNSSFHENTHDDYFDKNSAKIGWRDRLEYEEVMLVELVCGNLMESFGYKKSIEDIDEDKAINLFKNDTKIETFYSNWKNNRVGLKNFQRTHLINQPGSEFYG